MWSNGNLKALRLNYGRARGSFSLLPLLGLTALPAVLVLLPIPGRAVTESLPTRRRTSFATSESSSVLGEFLMWS